MVNILLKKDSRDALYHQKYGQTMIFPLEFNVDTPAIDTIQPPGNVMCTAISTVEIAQDQTGVQYDYVDLFKRVPSTKEGAEPRLIFKEAIKNGLLPVGGDVRVFKWKSFWRADSGEFDYFSNIQSAIYLANSPIGCATAWYWDWVNETVLSEGKSFSNYHMFCIEGWTVINGEPHLIIDAWVGRKLYMSRAVCNSVMSRLGSQAWVFATEEITEKRTKTILQKIIDLLTNFIISFKKQMPMPQEEKTIVDTVTLSTGSEKLYSTAKSLLKKHLTLNKAIPKNVGCAQCASFILKEAGYPIPKNGISGTYTLYEWLIKHFYKSEKPEKGSIIISVSETGNGKTRGHVGFFLDFDGKDWVIASNDSKTGLLDTNWKYQNWLANYKVYGKLKTVIFKAK